MKNLFFYSMVATLILFSSCQRMEDEKIASRVFSFASSNRMSHFDPHNAQLPFEQNVISQVYDALVKRDENFEIVPNLAVSWERLDNLRWEFALREGVVFQDLSPFTSEDVVASWERAKKGDEGTIPIVDKISNIFIISDYSIIIETKRDMQLLIEELETFFIMDGNWIRSYSKVPYSSMQDSLNATKSRANGTATYRLSYFNHGEEIVFRRNLRYWGGNEAYYDIIYFYMADRDSLIDLIDNRKVDLIYPITKNNLNAWRDYSLYSFSSFQEARVIFLGLDQYRDTLLGSMAQMNENPFKDKRVREAINLAIDRNFLNHKYFQNEATFVGVLSSPMFQNNPKDTGLTRPYPYDLERAQALMQEAGYGAGFTVDFNVPSGRYLYDKEIGKDIALMLEKINVYVNLKPENTSDYFQRVLVKKDTSMYMIGWTPVAIDAFDIVSRHIVSPSEGRDDGTGSANISGYNNEEINRAYVALYNLLTRVTSDEAFDEFRTQVYQNFVTQAYIITKRDFAFVPLYVPPFSVLSRANIMYYMSPTEELRLSSIRPKNTSR